MIGFIIHGHEELEHLSAEDLREKMAELMRAYTELEEENQKLAGDLEELRDDLEEAKSRAEAKEEDEESAGLAIAEACENFSKYQSEAGGAWYKKDLREFFENIAEATRWLETSATRRIEDAAPIF